VLSIRLLIESMRSRFDFESRALSLENEARQEAAKHAKSGCRDKGHRQLPEHGLAPLKRVQACAARISAREKARGHPRRAVGDGAKAATRARGRCAAGGRAHGRRSRRDARHRAIRARGTGGERWRALESLESLER